MKKRVLVKAIVATFLSIVIGLYFYFDEINKSTLGKDEYLKRQSIRFDQFYLRPHISVILGTLLLGVILFGLYELICGLIFKISNKTENKGNNF
jgi:hypothetical protein